MDHKLEQYIAERAAERAYQRTMHSCPWPLSYEDRIRLMTACNAARAQAYADMREARAILGIK